METSGKYDIAVRHVYLDHVDIIPAERAHERENVRENKKAALEILNKRNPKSGK